MRLKFLTMTIKIALLFIFSCSAPIASFAVLPTLRTPLQLGSSKATGRLRHRHRRQRNVQHILRKTQLNPLSLVGSSSPITINPIHVMAAIPLAETFNAIGASYSLALSTHPLLTKAVTSVVLCGAADVIAQLRSKGALSYLRIVRFASKAFVGGVLWAMWYDFADWILRDESILSGFSLLGIGGSISDGLTLGIIKTVLSLLIEQFIWCPIIFGLWEIPMATLLNGASLSRIPIEIKNKLGNMLFENAKVWTLANVIIYNAPIQYRAGLGNIVDVFWQTIVSDFAADCGAEECKLEENTGTVTELALPRQFLDGKVVITVRNDMARSTEQMTIPQEPVVESQGSGELRNATVVVG